MPKKRLNILEILIEIIILVFFTRLMFNINYFVGVFYLIAIGVAVYRKILFRKKYIAWMIIGGTLLSYFASLFIPYVVGNYRAGNFLSAIILLILVLLLWTKARRLKRGKK